MAQERMNLLFLSRTQLDLASLWVDADIEVPRVHDERHVVPEGQVSELRLVMGGGLLGEKVVGLLVQENICQPPQGPCLEQIPAGLITEHSEVGKDGPKLAGH